MWTYEQRTGALRHNGQSVATGYSGRDVAGVANGKNNPELQDVQELGPIPRGLYLIGPSFDSEEHGPVTMRLRPCHSTDTFGRSNFLIHGDSFTHPGEASHGCIVLSRSTRLSIASSGDDQLEVVE